MDESIYRAPRKRLVALAFIGVFDFGIPPRATNELAHQDSKLPAKQAVEPDEFTIFAGPDSVDLKSATLQVSP